MSEHGDLWWPTHAELAAQAGVDELWQAYCTTWVRISLPEGTVQVRPSLVVREASPPAGDLHVITACDPASRGDRLDDDKRLALLRRALRGHLFFPAGGFRPGWGARRAQPRGVRLERSRGAGVGVPVRANRGVLLARTSLVGPCLHRRASQRPGLGNDRVLTSAENSSGRRDLGVAGCRDAGVGLR